jgi:hypothetical protein
MLAGTLKGKRRRHRVSTTSRPKKDPGLWDFRAETFAGDGLRTAKPMPLTTHCTQQVPALSAPSGTLADPSVRMLSAYHLCQSLPLTQHILVSDLLKLLEPGRVKKLIAEWGHSSPQSTSMPTPIGAGKPSGGWFPSLCMSRGPNYPANWLWISTQFSEAAGNITNSPLYPRRSQSGISFTFSHYICSL